MSRLIAVLLLASLRPDASVAQQVAGGALLQRYTLTEPAHLRVRSLELITTSFSGRAPLLSGMSLGVNGAYARASLRLENDAEERTSGLVDTRVSLQIRNDRLLFTASALVPTGDVVRNLGDATVAGLLSTDLMPFAITQWGTGGGVAGDVAYAVYGPRAALRVAAGGATFMGSSPLEGPLAYRPAWQLRGRAEVEAAVGEAGVLSVLVGYRQFGVDRYGHLNLFQPGARLEGGLSYAFARGPLASTVIYGNVTRVARGTSQVEPRFLAELGALSGLGNASARTVVRLGGEMRLDRATYDLMPRAEVRVLRRADGLGQGWLTTIGTGGALHLWGGTGGRGVHAEPTVALRYGRVVAAEDLESEILGIEAGLAIRWGMGR